MSETTQTQLPEWAKEAGWTEQDVADGWRLRGEDFRLGGKEWTS